MSTVRLGTLLHKRKSLLSLSMNPCHSFEARGVTHVKFHLFTQRLRNSLKLRGINRFLRSHCQTHGGKKHTRKRTSAVDYRTLGTLLFTAAGWCIWDWVKIIYGTRVHCNKGTRHPGQQCDWCSFNRFWTKGKRAAWQRQISFNISGSVRADFSLLIELVDSRR